MHFKVERARWHDISLIMCLVLLGAALVGCGGGGGAGSEPEPVVENSLTVISDQSTSSSDPNIVISGRNANIQAWADPYSDTLKQSYYESSDKSVKVRVKYDSYGQPTRIENEVTGGFIQVVPNGTDRVDYLHYDANGSYVSGYAVFLVGDKLYQARIIGKPAVSDGQISGVLADSSAANNGSYSVIAQNGASAGLADITEVDAQTYAMLGKLLDAQLSLYGRSSLTPVLSTLKDILPTAGIIVAGGAVAVGVITGAPIAGAYVAAGVTMMILGPIAGRVDQWVTNNFDAGDVSAQEAVDTGLEMLVDPAASLGDFWDNLKGRLGDSQEYVSSTVEDVKSSIDNLTSLEDYDGETSSLEAAGSVPADGPDFIDTPITGQAAFQDGSVYAVSGTVDVDGTITATGTALNTTAGSSTVTIDAVISNDQVTGQFNTSKGTSGTVDGSAKPLGECQASTGSGGEGAFTYSHYVGSGSGSVDFFYEAYGIPDAFTVSTSNGVKFATPGLVSGSQTVSVAMTGEQIVFVSVTAPNSGTAWEYSLGCIAQ